MDKAWEEMVKKNVAVKEKEEHAILQRNEGQQV
jgi:hypothetical protein